MTPTLEDYLKAVQTIDDYVMSPDSNWSELKSDRVVELRGILKAIRYMLRTEEGGSVLARCATVMRRHDDMSRKLGLEYHNG